MRGDRSTDGDFGTRELFIFPCNGNGIEALDCIGPAFQLVGFIDDTVEKQGLAPYGLRVFDRTMLSRSPDALVLAVPGGPASFRLRRTVIDGLGVESERFATVIHPTARVSPLATIGRNVLIMAGVVVTSNAVISDHVCILPNTVIHHDVTIGPWTMIGSNVTIAGHTAIAEACYIGSGCSLMNGLSIGAGALVGLGSNVTRSVAPGSTVAGNPARALR